MYDFLINSFTQLQQNLRNIIQLWAKDLGIDTSKRVEIRAEDLRDAEAADNEAKAPAGENDPKAQAKAKGNVQDEMTYQYLLSIANLIELERVTMFSL